MSGGTEKLFAEILLLWPLGPSSGLSASMEAAQQEDFKTFRFWKGSAGSLRHRSAADIPDIRYRQEPISPAGRAGVSQHHVTVASSSQQVITQCLWICVIHLARTMFVTIYMLCPVMNCSRGQARAVGMILQPGQILRILRQLHMPGTAMRQLQTYPIRQRAHLC